MFRLEPTTLQGLREETDIYILTHCTGGGPFAKWRPPRVPGWRLCCFQKPPTQREVGRCQVGNDQRKIGVICFLCTGMVQGAALTAMAATQILG